MPSIRFRLDSSALERLDQTVREKYGALARVLSTEEVRVGGIGGFFARRFTDVVVEVPDPTAPEQWTAIRLDDLIDRADRKDGPIDASPLPPLSTESEAFTDVLDDLRRYASPRPEGERAPRRPARPVVVLRAPGDLVVIAGIGEDGLTVARALAAGSTAQVMPGGSVPGDDRVTDHRSAFAARARGVEQGLTTIVGYGIGAGEAELARHAAALAALRPDQLWIAVDASRKPRDTERWVTALSTVVSVQAMAVLRSDWTGSPETVRSLGIPEAWSDAVG